MEFFCYHRDRSGSMALREELLEEHQSYMDGFATQMIARGPTLTVDGDAATGSVHILDLPDTDSIEQAHRMILDRLLPMVDLLVWVVDPQKYADDALHSGYLRHLVGHESAMTVVLNHIDTVRPEMRDELATLLARHPQPDPRKRGRTH